MGLVSEVARVGARGIDSVQRITLAQAKALKASGYDFWVGYLGGVTKDALDGVVGAGMAFMPVTYSEHFDGAAAVGQCQALGLPKGTTVWLDFEGKNAWSDNAVASMSAINEWSKAILGADYMPGLYVGSPQGLTSDELYRLATLRYWRGQGRIVDRGNQLAEPLCGWGMTQMYPSVMVEGVWADVNVIGQDYFGRLPVWVKAG